MKNKPKAAARVVNTPAGAGIDQIATNLPPDIAPNQQEAVDSSPECRVDPRPEAQKGRSIFDFKERDIIINVLPRKIRRIIEGYGSFSLWGSGSREVEEPELRYRQPLELLGVHNNLIYLRTVKGEGINERANLHKAPLDDLEDGWELFTLPHKVAMSEAAGIPASPYS